MHFQLNQEKSAALQKDAKYVKFNEWLTDNGAIMNKV